MRALALAAGLALVLPAVASAQDPPVVPTPTPIPTPAPVPPPPKPRLTLALDKVLRAGDDVVVLSGRRFTVKGTVTPAVAREKLRLFVYRNGDRSRVLTVRTRADGSFSRRIPTRRAARISVRVLHRASRALAAARGPKVTVGVVEPRLSYGASGPLVRLLQRGLAALHYAVPRNGGSYDDGTGRAVMAYRKVNRMPRRYDANRRVITRVLAGRGAFQPRHRDAGHHVEADLSRQVLALIDGADVVATYHTSSGSPATPTVIGNFRVYMKTPGTNAKGMVHSSYFIRGYAIHGYYDVPAFNASHGCLRVPVPDAWRIFSWLHIGDRVIVYP